MLRKDVYEDGLVKGIIESSPDGGILVQNILERLRIKLDISLETAQEYLDKLIRPCAKPSSPPEYS